MPSALPAWLLPPSGQALKPRGSNNKRAARPSATHTGASPDIHPTNPKSAAPTRLYRSHSTTTEPPQAAPASMPPAHTKVPLPISAKQEADSVKVSDGRASGFLEGHKSLVQAQRKHALGLAAEGLTRIATKRRLKLHAPLGITHRSRKRVQLFGVVKAAQRCGHCKTCHNRSMKKACLTRRTEMEAMVAAAPVNVKDPVQIFPDNAKDRMKG